MAGRPSPPFRLHLAEVAGAEKISRAARPAAASSRESGERRRPFQLRSPKEAAVRTRFLKTVLLFLLSGVILGAVIASLIAPALYTCTPSPAAGTQEIISRVEVIREATGMLLRAQSLGAGIGGLAGLIA